MHHLAIYQTMEEPYTVQHISYDSDVQLTAW
jgi:hypothetical protein